MATDQLVDLQASFHAAMGQLVAAVSVVTTWAGGRPQGVTVSALHSLSMDSPMVMLALDNRSSFLAWIAPGQRIGVNVLAADHACVAMRFASRDVDQFATIDWSLRDDVPVLAGRHVGLVVEVASLVPGGDHTIVLGQVLDAQTHDNVPLAHWKRSFGTHQAAVRQHP